MDGGGASNGSKAGQGGWSADLAITYRPIGELIPYARNARTQRPASSGS